ncbi:MAG: DUF5618 family protein [Deltaproteobacteria bacterium]|nr:DUF5618 family protein [Deltaproteobacteria bacterium]
MKREALRYLDNAKEILGKSPIEDNTYLDIKYVKTACGVAYLGVLEAINEVLLKKGFTKKELPKKVEEYRKALQKHVSAHNGKLLREFEMLYDALHIAGYYRGLIYNTDAIKDYLKAAKDFIGKLH